MESQPTILVVDDEEVIRDSCRKILERCRYRVETARDGYEGLRLLRSKPIDLVLLDLKMPGLEGTEFLRRARAENPELDVIVITGYSSVGSAVDCMRLGAYDYLPKPFNAESLRMVVGRALEKRLLALENRALRRRLREVSPPDVLQGRSPAVERVREMIARVAPAETTVLILGESGTGKELVARAIHRGSPRASRPFVTVDCGALVESLCENELFGHVKGAFTGAIQTRPGRIETADGGTLFLDEIGNIGPGMQGKLLRVLQEREITRVGGQEPLRVDVRIIAATNRDLRAAMYSGRFREDLFYRLSVVLIEIPPLRSRREDIPILARELLHRVSERKQLPMRQLSADAIRMMQIHSWPGNVRELENTLERALLMAQGPEILAEDLHFVDRGKEPAIGRSEPPDQDPYAAAIGAEYDSLAARGPDAIRDPAAGATAGAPHEPLSPAESAVPAARQDPQDLRLSAHEARHIRKVLEMTGWQVGRAAHLLGIDRKTLWRKVREYRLRDFGDPEAAGGERSEADTKM
jgi:two-component system, NtrC family, response regulator HydG